MCFPDGSALVYARFDPYVTDACSSRSRLFIIVDTGLLPDCIALPNPAPILMWLGIRVGADENGLRIPSLHTGEMNDGVTWDAFGKQLSADIPS